MLYGYAFVFTAEIKIKRRIEMATIQDSSSARAVEQKEHPLISRGLAIGNIGGLFCIGALLITAKNVGLFTTPEAFAIGKTIVVGAAKLSATFFALPA